MKNTFDKLISPVWKKWTEKLRDDYKDRMNLRADYLRFTLHIITFKNPNMNEEINEAQIDLTGLTIYHESKAVNQQKSGTLQTNAWDQNGKSNINI